MSKEITRNHFKQMYWNIETNLSIHVKNSEMAKEKNIQTERKVADFAAHREQMIFSASGAASRTDRRKTIKGPDLGRTARGKTNRILPGGPQQVQNRRSLVENGRFCVAADK